MDDELRAAYDRIDGALTPPGDTVALVAQRVAARRRRRTTGTMVASATAVAVIAGSTWVLQGDEPASAARIRRRSPDLVAPTDVATPTDPPEAADRHEPTVEGGEPDLLRAATAGGRHRTPPDYPGAAYGPETVEPWLLPGAPRDVPPARRGPDHGHADRRGRRGVRRARSDRDRRQVAARVDRGLQLGCSLVSTRSSGTRSTNPAPGRARRDGERGIRYQSSTHWGSPGSWRSECVELPEGLLGVGQAYSSNDELTLHWISRARSSPSYPAGTVVTSGCSPRATPRRRQPTSTSSATGAKWRVAVGHQLRSRPGLPRCQGGRDPSVGTRPRRGFSLWPSRRPTT